MTMKAPLGREPSNARAPHPATVAQPQKPQHPAKVAQAKTTPPSLPQIAARKPHPALAQKKTPAAPTAQRALAQSGTVKQSNQVAPRGSLLVDDDVAPAEGQIRKTAFLKALRAAVTQVAQQVLASVGQSARDCPYIPYWFAYYDDMRAEHIERAILKYAPKASTAKTYRDYIEFVAAQVRVAFEANVKTGSLDGVPQGVPRDLETKIAAQAKMRSGTIQMCPCGSSSEQSKSKAIDDSLREAKRDLDNWRQNVPLNGADEIVFRKLSRVIDFDPTSDEKYRPITALNWKANEAMEGISLSRNPYFGMDVVRTGNNKLCYACVIPARGAYDLEAAYLGTLRALPDEYGGTRDVTQYTAKNQLHNVLSQEITAEQVLEKNIIGWVSRKDDALVYTKNPKRDSSLNISALNSYPRFQIWVQLLQELKCNGLDDL